MSDSDHEVTLSSRRVCRQGSIRHLSLSSPDRDISHDNVPAYLRTQYGEKCWIYTMTGAVEAD